MMLLATKRGAVLSGWPDRVTTFSNELLEIADGESLIYDRQSGRIEIKAVNARLVYQVVRDDFAVDAVGARLIEWADRIEVGERTYIDGRAHQL